MFKLAFTAITLAAAVSFQVQAQASSADKEGGKP